MDVLGGYDVQTIGIVSSITVFSMALVSIAKQINSKKIPCRTAIPLAIGSVTGGIIGEMLLDFIVDKLKANSVATVIQNIILAILILCVFLYMKNKVKIKGKELKGVFVSLAVGVFLGCC